MLLLKHLGAALRVAVLVWCVLLSGYVWGVAIPWIDEFQPYRLLLGSLGVLLTLVVYLALGVLGRRRGWERW